MYVDKKLGGVNAVQTLSRLNRKKTGKNDAFVIDFVNNTDDIEKAFQPYYTTTILSKATDPNILHDLERDILHFKLFTMYELNGLIDIYFSKNDPSAINATLDIIVERYNEMLDEEKGSLRRNL